MAPSRMRASSPAGRDRRVGGSGGPSRWDTVSGANPSAPRTHAPRVTTDSGTLEGISLGPGPGGASSLVIPSASQSGAYKQWLQHEFGFDAGKVFAAYPASTDSEVPSVFTTMFSDYDFGFGARLLASDTARIGQSAFLYRFTSVGAGPFAGLGAFHSEENMFLTRKYWSTWGSRAYDKTLSDAIIENRVQFAKTGNPHGNHYRCGPRIVRRRICARS